MAGKKRIRLVHTSDTHLGDDWRSSLAERAFARVIDCVNQLEADALLVVGDVFDHARVPDRVLQFFLGQVARLDRPVITLPGNHDLYHRDSLYRREPFRHAPNNFLLFTGHDGQTITLSELGVELWGRAMTEHTPEFRPLQGMPASSSEQWLVALAHGHFHFPDDKETCALRLSWPGRKLKNAPCDYLALGHWERHVDGFPGKHGWHSTRGHPWGQRPDDQHHISVNVADLDPDCGCKRSAG